MGEAERKCTRVRLTNQLDGQPIVRIVDALRQARMSDLDINVQDVRSSRPIRSDILLAAVTTWKADGLLLSFSNPSSDFIHASEAAGPAVRAPIQTDGASTRLSF